MATQNTRNRQRLGAEVARARDTLGMSTQQALATAAALGLRTVVAVETGEKVAGRTLRKIEAALGWPAGSADDYLTGAAETPPQTRMRPAATTNPPHEWSAQSRAKILAMPVDDIVETGRQIRTTSGTRAQILWLSEALRLKAEAEGVPPDEDVR